MTYHRSNYIVPGKKVAKPMTRQPEMRLVPTVADDAMHHAGQALMETHNASDVWSAMLSAAPHPDPGVGEREALTQLVDTIAREAIRSYCTETHFSVSTWTDRVLAALKASEKQGE